MIRLNRTTEYALISLGYLANRSTPARFVSARELADAFSIPYEMLSKTLQRLKEFGVLGSEHGARGGYFIAKNLSEISLVQFLDFMEGTQAVVSCTTTDATSVPCTLESKCEMKSTMFQLNQTIRRFLSEMNLEKIVASFHPETVPEILEIK